MSKTCIAIDIGASSGRIIAGTIKERKVDIQEVYRFKNNMYKENNHYYWDIDQLFNEILSGLKVLYNLGTDAESIGVDTWAVDYVLLNKDNQRICPVYAYRDHRTNSTVEALSKDIELKTIYEKTGIQFLQFNTIYQLYEHFKEQGEVLNSADTFLMIPDYLHFLLSNEKTVEFTNATTTQLFNIHELDWDKDLIKLTGVNKNIFPKTIIPGVIIGSLTKEIQEMTGLSEMKVIAPATHDTGSAVVSVPATSEDFAYISSGTWSLMGIESKVPICSEKAREYNFTNEGGAFNTFRVLKNIMGLWLIQEVQRLYDNKYSFGDLVMLAEASEPFKCLINPNNSRFLNPNNMIEEIRAYCSETGQVIPETPGEISRCVFESLAFQYKQVLLQLEEINEKEINKIHIIGGGVQNKFLNQLCASFTQCEVFAGPIEATAIGNLAVQFISLGEVESLKEARSMILDSFEVEKYSPVNSSEIEVNWNRFKALP